MLTPPPGHARNPRYAERSTCPACGSVLEVLRTPAVVVTGRCLSPDSEEVTRTERDGFKAERVTCGFRTRYTLRCPQCDRLLTPGMAVHRDLRPGELPGDYFVPDVADTREARVEAIREGLREIREGRRRRLAPRRPPEQGELPIGGGGGA